MSTPTRDAYGVAAELTACRGYWSEWRDRYETVEDFVADFTDVLAEHPRLAENIGMIVTAKRLEREGREMMAQLDASMRCQSNQMEADLVANRERLASDLKHEGRTQ